MKNLNEQLNHPSVVTITPEIAKDWLKRRPLSSDSSYSQRNVKPRVVDRYCADMKSGNWVLNGEMIKFDIQGKLVDGQHRLEACIESGVSFNSFVLRNVPVESFFTIDTGSIRSNRDVFRMSGLSFANMLSTAVAIVWRYKNNKITSNEYFIHGAQA